MRPSESDPSTEWYENGKKKREGHLKNGKQDGVWTTWHENGQKSREVNYRDGVPVGSWTTWYETGKIKRIGSFDRKGSKDGLWVWYDKDGCESARADYKEEPLLNEWALHPGVFGLEGLTADRYFCFHLKPKHCRHSVRRGDRVS